METVLKLEREEAVKKIARFREHLFNRMMYRPETLEGTKEECTEACMNLENIKDLLKDSKSKEVIFYSDERDIFTLPKKRLKVYLPGGKKYWEDFVYFKC